jgi:hypothetical protein
VAAAVADADDAATAADADARSCVTANASTRGLPLSGCGCSAVRTMRPVRARPTRATPHVRKRPRVIRRRIRCNLRLSMPRATPGSIARSRAGDDAPGLQFHRVQGAVGRGPARDLALTVAVLWTWAIRDEGTLTRRRRAAQPSLQLRIRTGPSPILAPCCAIRRFVSILSHRVGIDATAANLPAQQGVSASPDQSAAVSSRARAGSRVSSMRSLGCVAAKRWGDARPLHSLGSIAPARGCDVGLAPAQPA